MKPPKPPRAVRAMNETLKQNRLLREQGDDGSFSPSNDRNADLQKNVCFLSLGNREPALYSTLFFSLALQ